MWMFLYLLITFFYTITCSKSTCYSIYTHTFEKWLRKNVVYGIWECRTKTNQISLNILNSLVMIWLFESTTFESQGTKKDK